MLHNLELPDRTRAFLTEAMLWQFRLLNWAAQTDVCDRGHCQGWLKGITRTPAQAEAIAKWIYDAEVRRTSLGEFAGDKAVDRATKAQWVNTRRVEALRLLSDPQGELEVHHFRDNNIPKWQKAASTFFISFYDSFRKSSLPDCLFERNERYTAQIFLQDFLEKNAELCVCPVCGVTAYFTLVQRQGKRSVYTDIDHYLPKDTYPHLAIHPYNLVPICHSCNSGVKGTEDPLRPNNGIRRRLNDIWLPYRDIGLRNSVFIPIRINSGAFVFDPFVVKQGAITKDIDILNEVFARVYKLPNRWQEHIDEIGEKLFRRMRDYMRFFRLEPGGEQAQIYLDELLYIFDQEDMQREPYATLMLWWLAYLLEHELSLDGSSLSEEIIEWNKHQHEHSAKMRDHGRALRAALANHH